MSDVRPKTVAGKVVRRRVSAGSKSEREAIVLETREGDYVLRRKGGNPFRDESLPRAIIRFKQGLGRLIRSASDEGRVVVLDPRIARSSYGRLFLDAVPEGVPVRLTSEESGVA